MKKLLMALVFSINLSAQDLPISTLETLDGGDFSTQSIVDQSDKPIVLTFFATWCIPCLTELSAINENLEQWKKNYRFDLHAISVDDDRTAKKVPSLKAGKGWEFSILLDTNQDFKRKLNINSIPYLLIVKNGKIIYNKTGFVKGDEAKIEKVIADHQ